MLRGTTPLYSGSPFILCSFPPYPFILAFFEYTALFSFSISSPAGFLGYISPFFHSIPSPAGFLGYIALTGTENPCPNPDIPELRQGLCLLCCLFTFYFLLCYIQISIGKFCSPDMVCKPCYFCIQQVAHTVLIGRINSTVILQQNLFCSGKFIPSLIKII